ncbi:hypothetical protein [Desulfobulbus elongatus]|uniref:hypothetical protein n=1 Tax=Desulfobulbus elongatus TaxID=53332 RepID=UPI000AD58A91|nr:hypothetical protein [Desulfobulbus elongatus]
MRCRRHVTITPEKNNQKGDGQKTVREMPEKHAGAGGLRAAVVPENYLQFHYLI